MLPIAWIYVPRGKFPPEKPWTFLAKLNMYNEKGWTCVRCDTINFIAKIFLAKVNIHNIHPSKLQGWVFYKTQNSVGTFVHFVIDFKTNNSWITRFFNSSWNLSKKQIKIHSKNPVLVNSRLLLVNSSDFLKKIVHFLAKKCHKSAKSGI